MLNIIIVFALLLLQKNVFAVLKDQQKHNDTLVECKMGKEQQQAVEVSQDLIHVQSSVIKPIAIVNEALEKAPQRKSNEEVIESYLLDEKIKEKVLILGCQRTKCRRKEHGQLGELTLNWDDACDTDLVLNVTDIWKQGKKISVKSKIFNTIVDEDCCPVPNLLDEASGVNDAEKKESSESDAKKLLVHLHELLGADGLFVETTTGCGHNNTAQRADFINKTGLFYEIREPFERNHVLKKTVLSQVNYVVDLNKEQADALCELRGRIKKYTYAVDPSPEFLDGDVRKKFCEPPQNISDPLKRMIQDLLSCIAYTQMMQVTGDHSLSTQQLSDEERATVKNIKKRLRLVANPNMQKLSTKKQIVTFNSGNTIMHCMSEENSNRINFYLNAICSNESYGLYKKIGLKN